MLQMFGKGGTDRDPCRSTPTLEALEDRRLLAAAVPYPLESQAFVTPWIQAEWGALPKLVGQDLAAQRYPQIDGTNTSIAIIDTGIDYHHPSLGGGFGSGHKVVAGWDFIDNDADPMDSDGHGTAVASVAAGKGFVYGGAFYQGAAPAANLIALRAEAVAGTYDPANLEAALRWVLDHRVQYHIASVVMSLGEGSYTSRFSQQPLGDELAALKAARVYVACSNGNGGLTSPAGIKYPAADPSAFAISASNGADQVCRFAQRSTITDLLAPGENLPISGYNPATGQEGHALGGGTSFAVPYVAGTVALLKQIKPAFTANQVNSILRTSGKLVWDPGTGVYYPRLNIAAAIAKAYRWAGVRPSPSPFAAAPINATTTIEAENYDRGGEGIGYHDTTSANQGFAYRNDRVDVQARAGGAYHIGWTRPGEWLAYTVKVDEAGTFNFRARVANAASGGSFHLEIDGVDRTSAIAIPNTGGWQAWKTVARSGIQLTAGVHMVRLVFNTAASSGYAGNLDRFTFAE